MDYALFYATVPENCLSCNMNKFKTLTLLLILCLTPSVCCLAQDIVPTSERIVEGSTLPKPIPQIAMLLYQGRNGSYIGCAGTLVASNKVITAGHCVDDRRPVAVALGRRNFREAEGVEIGIRHISIHPEFNDETLENDLAVISLQSDAPFPPIRLAEENLQPGTALQVYGWGYTSPNFSNPSEELQYTTVGLISNEECNGPTGYRGLVTKKMLCAGFMEGGPDSCGGDSGGPLLLNDSSGSRLVGLVSWGASTQCGERNKPGVYTRLIIYVDWIRKKISDEGLLDKYKELLSKVRNRDSLVGFSTLSGQNPGITILRRRSLYLLHEDGQVRLLRVRRAGGTVLLADIDGDGQTEILHAIGRKLHLYTLRDGAFEFSKTIRLPLSAEEGEYMVATGDVNGDGRHEVIYFDRGKLSVYQSIEGEWQRVLRTYVGGDQVLLGSLDEQTPADIFVRRNGSYTRLSLFGVSIRRILPFRVIGQAFIYDVDGDGVAELVDLSRTGKHVKLRLASQSIDGFRPLELIRK
jgi:secreted trypsin-like serine protease